MRMRWIACTLQRRWVTRILDPAFDSSIDGYAKVAVWGPLDPLPDESVRTSCRASQADQDKSEVSAWNSLQETPDASARRTQNLASWYPSKARANCIYRVCS
ncbi:unnamed protein product [Sphagnum jensenii]|uniref:Uncharacterized protein n=1 Tax=Sphagnum jensenii TaxID=128206 RepID=A0ABP0W6H8_9BRYO